MSDEEISNEEWIARRLTELTSRIDGIIGETSNRILFVKIDSSQRASPSYSAPVALVRMTSEISDVVAEAVIDILRKTRV